MKLPNFSGKDQDIFIKASPRDQVAIAIQFAEHAAAEAECHAFGELIAKKCGCRLIKGPMKTLERATDKVVKDYKGDRSKVKDLVRMTILGMTPRQVTDAGTAIRTMAIPPWHVLKDEEAVATVDECGYSGFNFVLQKNRQGSVGMPKLGQREVAPGPDADGISNAEWAKTVRMEIQVNVPEIIYGKEVEEDFIKMLGDIGFELFQNMKGKYKIVGGLGHVFYEISTKGDPDDQVTAKALSKRYYAYLRDPMKLSPMDFKGLCSELFAFVQKNRLAFKKHPVPVAVSLVAPGKIAIPAAFQ